MDLPEQIKVGARKIRKGELVAFPTETIYGLGANALDAKACAKIFKAKGRPADNPLIVHVSNEEMLRGIVKHIPRDARKLMNAFWPGPLTIILKKNHRIPDIVNPYKRVAARMPDHPIALALIEQSGVPIAAPSANKSGRPSPTSAKHVQDDFPDLFIIDGGRTRHGLESTIVEIVKGEVRVYRQGAITLEQIRKITPNAILTTLVGKKQVSPGTKYKHYAPKQPLIIFRNKAALRNYALTAKGAVVLCDRKNLREFKGLRCVDLGATEEEIAHNLYDIFRNAKGAVLLFLAVPKRGIGRAIMDRVERAATKII